MIQAAVDRARSASTARCGSSSTRGSATVVGRKSKDSLYSLDHVTFEDDQVYDQRDAEGFIKLQALRLRLAKALRD